jgi:hypothetical protein
MTARSTQLTPGGIRVCGRAPLTAEELDALDQLADAVRRGEEIRRAALTDEERTAEDTKRAEGQARLRRAQKRARESR